MNEYKIADLPGVREHNEEYPVELWMTSTGRIVIRAWNEGYNNTTEVDLYDLLEAIKAVPLPAPPIGGEKG